MNSIRHPTSTTSLLQGDGGIGPRAGCSDANHYFYSKAFALESFRAFETYWLDDWWFLTPDERLSEVAAILAAGVLRPHGRAAWTDCSGYADRQLFGRRQTRVLPGRPSP